MAKYSRYRILRNASEYYAPLREGRDVKIIEHFETPTLSHPTVAQRTALKTTRHIWKYGDRLYKMANQYYGDVRFWWIIAWYNGAPTEASLKVGDAIEIPLNIEDALRVLGMA